MANCIISLRRLNSQDWNRFEEVSLVQQVLTRIPCIYCGWICIRRYRGMMEGARNGQDEIAIAQRQLFLQAPVSMAMDSPPTWRH